MCRVAALTVAFAGLALGAGTASGQSPTPPIPPPHGDPPCAFDATSCDPLRLAAVARVRAACDRSRLFQGVKFEGPFRLSTTWLQVGRSLGTMLIVSACLSSWTGPDDPPRAIGRTHRVTRLKGISPRVALSLGGASRRILLAHGVCEPTPIRESALVRCLRRASAR